MNGPLFGDSNEENLAVMNHGNNYYTLFGSEEDRKTFTKYCMKFKAVSTFGFV